MDKKKSKIEGGKKKGKKKTTKIKKIPRRSSEGCFTNLTPSTQFLFFPSDVVKFVSLLSIFLHTHSQQYVKKSLTETCYEKFILTNISVDFIYQFPNEKVKGEKNKCENGNSQCFHSHLKYFSEVNRSLVI